MDLIVHFVATATAQTCLSPEHLKGIAMKRYVLLCVAACLLSSTSGLNLSAQDGAAENTRPRRAAVERTRKTVRMLDDVYKTAVVLITDKYVNDEEDFPAGSAAIALFEAIGEKGWHQARLIDLTGQPYDEKNVAKDDFEKEASLQIKEGKAYFDKVEVQDGKPVLRAMTAVPVVLQKCAICHPHYKDTKPGAAIGAIVYTVPIE